MEQADSLRQAPSAGGGLRGKGMSAPTRLFLGAYSGLWRAAQPLLRRHKRLRDDFARRLVPDDWLAAGQPGPAAAVPDIPGPGAPPLRVWVQAASGGEAWLVHSLVPALAEALAGHPALASRPLCLLCTAWTRQGLDILEKLPASPAVSILSRHFPLDRPDMMRRAMAMARPDAVVLLETELWPGLLAAARENGVPVLALNARMTEKSFRAYGKLAFFWREHAPERILAISAEDADRFARLFGHPERVEVMPNIKFDRLLEHSHRPAREDSPASFRRKAGIGDAALLAVLASVREEEESLLLPVARALHGLSINGHPVAVAVAPRHMHRVEAWKTGLRAAGVPFRLRSMKDGRGSGGDASPSLAASPVYLWDTFGELPSLYAIADAAYVGGSLVPLGGQNFLEASAQGVIPLVGPHIDNFLWAGKELFAEGLAVMLPEASELGPALEQRLQTRLASLPRAPNGRNPASTGLDGPDWQAARAKETAEVRRRFAAWLRPRLGGSMQAAEALAQVLAGRQ